MADRSLRLLRAENTEKPSSIALRANFRQNALRMNKLLPSIFWGIVALLGAAAVAVVAVHRGEPINALWLVVAATCCYALGYRFYSRFIATKILALEANSATPPGGLEK